MAVQLVVFDMAGTTVYDPDLVAQAFAQAFARHDLAVTLEQARPLLGFAKPEAIRRLLHDSGRGEWAEDAARVERIHADFNEAMARCYRSSDELRAMPGAEAAFARLRARGVRVALNTAFSRPIADILVERLGWQECIDDLVATDEVPAGRPAPYMIQRLMQRAGITEPAAVAKVGDTGVDVQEGRSAGCGCVVAVTTGAFRRAELQAYAPDAIIDSLDALDAVLWPAAASAA